MFFISRQSGDSISVVDTKDWVEETYPKEEIAKFKLLGIDIKSEGVQKEILSFMWSYWGLSCDCGSSGMDFVDSYLRGTCSIKEVEGGSSFKDILKDIKRSITGNFDIKDFGYESDVYKLVSKCLEADRWGRPTEQYIKILVNKYHFQEKYIRKAFYIMN